MSFGIAYAAPSWALCASDARVTRPNGQTVDEEAGKVRRLPGGWCIGGTWTLLTAVLHDALAEADLRRPVQVVAALEACRPTVARMLKAVDTLHVGMLLEDTNCGSFSQLAGGTARLFTVAERPEGCFALRIYDPVTATLETAVKTGGFCLSPAGVFDQEWLGERMARFGRDLTGVRPATLVEAVRLVGGFFQEVYELLGRVGGVGATVTCGVLARQPDGTVQAARLPLTRHGVLAQLSDEDLCGLLEPSPEPG
jgi:hypothetical protein